MEQLVQPHVKRMIEERDQLGERLTKLQSRITSLGFTLERESEQNDKRLQATYMKQYLEVLNRRIEREIELSQTNAGSEDLQELTATLKGYKVLEEVQLKQGQDTKVLTQEIMPKKEKLSDEELFERAADPLIQYLARNQHPHVKVIVDNCKAELVEGIKAYTTYKHLKDS